MAFPAVLALAFLPAIFILPSPDRLGPALLAAGAALELLPRANRWLRAASSGVTLSGAILLAQTLALSAYKHGTARSHELPWPLPQWLAGIARLLGVNAAADGSDLVLSSMRHNQHLGATWELFLDPLTVCFVAGGLLALWLTSCGHHIEEAGAGNSERANVPASGKARNGLIRASAKAWRSSGPGTKAAVLLVLATALWLPLRAGIEIGVFLHRVLRTDYESEFNLLNQFWSPWPHLLLLLPLAWLVARWTRGFAVPALPSSAPATSLRGRCVQAAVALAGATAAVFTLAVFWDPVGSPKAGRIAVDEHHSRWEPTQRPFDTEWYGHLSGYNYACLYDFCSRYYELSRLTNSITDAALASLDVLILKVPTEPFQPAETDAIVRFVERGGGLLLIGEHTDVFGTGYHLNQVARRFGFTFRYDCLFGMQSFFDQAFTAPLVRHPVLQNLRGFDFATSCSVDVGRSAGHGVIVSTGLKNSMADYHANNYYPQAVDHAAMRYGAFVQLWSTRQGRGRVLAFTDSTIFSNFSTFEPGKIELLLGMLEWLNRRDALGNPRPLLWLLGLALLAGTVWMSLKHRPSRPVLVAIGVLGWSAAALVLVAHQAYALPAPQAVRPLTWITIDRSLCDGPLSKGGFIAGKPDGFGIFERWILRLGYFLRRASGPEALQGELVVFFYPTRPPSDDFRAALLHYVEGGGKVLVLDSPRNEKSSAAALLQPFQLSQSPLGITNATLGGPPGWPAVPIEVANQITGGQALFHVNGKPVGAVARHGKGAVVALGFGSRFSDPHMGVTGDVEPDADLRKVFDLQFALLRAIVGDKLDIITPAGQ
jgi:hypothetical protein